MGQLRTDYYQERIGAELGNGNTGVPKAQCSDREGKVKGN